MVDGAPVPKHGGGGAGPIWNALPGQARVRGAVVASTEDRPGSAWTQNTPIPPPTSLAEEGAPHFLRAEGDAPPCLFPRDCYGNRGGAATVGLCAALLGA